MRNTIECNLYGFFIWRYFSFLDNGVQMNHYFVIPLAYKHLELLFSVLLTIVTFSETRLTICDKIKRISPEESKQYLQRLQSW
jgi:hypothetical protein